MNPVPAPVRLVPILMGSFIIAGADCGTSTPPGGTSQAAFEDAGLCEGTATPGATRPAPTGARLQGTTCGPSAVALDVAGGDAGPACASAADCVGDGGSPLFGRGACLQGGCTIDQCYTDSDCGAGAVCVCSGSVGGGNAQHANTCIEAHCKSDSDCGPGSYCLPSLGYCGGVQGFYCTTRQDSCVDPQTDCACVEPAAKSCQYAPQVGRWVCGRAFCAG